MDYVVEDGRHLAFALFYPAAPAVSAAAPTPMLFFTNLHIHVNAPVVDDKRKRPLIVFSHGAGSNGLYYAWFGEYLASRGYFVAMVYHYRANTYNSTVMYTRSKLWQRPRDIALDITSLLQDPLWGLYIDRDRIGVAGHSQGDSPRFGSAAPRSTPTCIEPISKAGETIRLCPNICALICRSIQSPRSTSTILASRRLSPWPRAT